MDFDDWMLTKDPKYHPTDDTVALRRLRECWADAQKYAVPPAPTFEELRRLNRALIKNAMNRPKDCPNCNTWAENEKLRAEAEERGHQVARTLLHGRTAS